MFCQFLIIKKKEEILYCELVNYTHNVSFRNGICLTIILPQCVLTNADSFRKELLCVIKTVTCCVVHLYADLRV